MHTKCTLQRVSESHHRPGSCECGGGLNYQLCGKLNRSFGVRAPNAKPKQLAGITVNANQPESRAQPGPFRVLCIDGGGMRGIYAATFLDDLGRRYAKYRGLGGHGLDLGKGFDLLVGTSTGAIVAMALAVGVPPSTVVNFYRRKGPSVFPVKVPTELGMSLLLQLWTRPKHLRAGEAALLAALEEIFGEMTLGELYRSRGIALAVPAVEMTTHHAWIFKTPHLPTSVGRDDDYRLTEVCKATSAAPIFRSLAAVNNPDGTGHRVFADGGLFANSPVMLGLVDALEMTSTGDTIEIYGLGTCPRPPGTAIEPDRVHWGFVAWAFGGRAVALALDAQDDVSWHMARLLSRHVDREIKLIRFPRTPIASSSHHFLDLDETGTSAVNALMMQAHSDVQGTLALCADSGDRDGQLIRTLLMEIPPAAASATE